MSFCKEVKSCVNKLQADYQNGFINYPRIDNGYISESEIFEFFPHKPFDNNFTKQYNAISAKTLPLNKRTSLLFLNNQRLITPSEALNYSLLIDDFLDENLEFRNSEKQKEFEEIFNILKNFLAEKLNTNDIDEQEKIIKNRQQSFFSNPTSIVFYDTPRYCFIKNLSSNVQSKRRSPQEILDFYYEKQKQSEKEKRRKEEYYRRKKHLEECFRDFLLTISRNKEKMQQMENIKATDEQNMANYLSNLE